MTITKYLVKNLIEETNYKFNFIKYADDEKWFERFIFEPLVHRLSLSVVGHFKLFPSNRIQICGFTEYSYLESLSKEERYKRLNDIISNFGSIIPVIIFTAGLKPFEELIELCRKYALPILATDYETVLFINELSIILEERLAKSNSFQGVMVSVFGVGIILTGESGIGKSEAAIELLKRGHLFVSDDIVKVYISSSGILMGTSEDIIKNFMEVRGIGIVDIKSIFGIGAILERCKIDLVIHLKYFSNMGDYDRLGEKKDFVEILKKKVPMIVLPVGPGRNIATLIEIAALNFRLQERGYSAVEELDRRFIEKTMKKDEK